MIHKRLTVWICLLVMAGMVNFSWVNAWDWDWLRVGCHTLWAGPEVYHAKRLRQGGSQQKGWLYGLRICCEREELNSLYWGIEGAWAEGRLNGDTPSGAELRSNMTDTEVEARLGFTMAGHCLTCFSIRPFIGIGYYQGVNRFLPPTPLPIRSADSWGFGTAGVATQFWCNDTWRVGLNVKARQMWNAKNRVSGDPGVPNIVTLIKDELNWVVEIPLEWYPWIYGRCCQVAATPFYQYRHLGGRESYPKDFFETKWWIYGGRLTFGVGF